MASTEPQGARTLLERDVALELYRQMTRVRAIEQRIADLYPEQEMRCPVHLCIGQEAIAAGICTALRPDDKVLSAHRSHGHYVAKGGDMRAMLAELYGKATGCADGKGGSMHLVDLDAGFVGATPVIGSTIPIAVGIAFAEVARGGDAVTVVFFGDAATEEGVFHEALLFAALRRLPVVFVCENNLFSVNSPLSVRQPAERDLGAIAVANGAAAGSGDGNDAVAVYELGREAVERARSGGGPTVLEFETYRWYEHCGPYFDQHFPLRGEDQLAAWKARDPIGRLRAALLERGLDEDDLDGVQEAAEAEVDDAVRFAKDSPFPALDTFATHVYAD